MPRRAVPPAARDEPHEPRRRPGESGESAPKESAPKESGPRHVAPDPLDQALGRVGDRWTLLVVRSLLHRPGRFNQLMEDVPGIAPNILTKRLRQLEIDGLVVSTPYRQRPVRLAYSLTEPGRELAAALEVLADWGSRQSGGGALLRHAPCGGRVELRPWCPQCNEPATELRAVHPERATEAADTPVWI